MTAGVPGEVSVLFVCHAPVVWGAQRWLLETAPLLAERRVLPALAAPAGDLVAAWAAAGLPVHTVKLATHRGLRRPGSRRRSGAVAAAADVLAVTTCAARIARVARRYDVLQSSSLHSHLDSIVAGTLARRPVVLDIHDLITPGVGRRLLAATSRRAALTIANSRAVADTVGGVGRPDVMLVNPAIDTDRFRPRPSDPVRRAELSARPELPLVGIVGRVDPRKGVDVVVDAFELLHSRGVDACLAVVGAAYVADPEWATALQRSAVARLGDRVRFLPPCPDPEAVIAELDVLVNASLHEPFGMTVLEAMSCRTAVVGTSAGGVPEFVVDGANGVLVPPRDPPALADALASLLGDDDRRSRLAAAGRATALARRGPAEEADRLAVAYRDVVMRRLRRDAGESGRMQHDADALRPEP